MKILTRNAIGVADALSGIGYCRLTAARAIPRPGPAIWGLAGTSTMDAATGISAEPLGIRVTIDPGSIFPCRRVKAIEEDRPVPVDVS